jgi:hypothetical protein
MVHWQVTLWWTSDHGPLTHVMHQNRPLTVPEQRQYNFTCRRLCKKFVGFRWMRMSSFFAHSLCFWLEIMDPAFICSHYALKKSISISLITPLKFFTVIHTPFLQFCCEWFWHLSCTHSCIIWSAEPWLIPSSKATLLVVTRQFSRITPSTCSPVSGV